MKLNHAKKMGYNKYPLDVTSPGPYQDGGTIKSHRSSDGDVVVWGGRRTPTPEKNGEKPLDPVKKA